MSAGRIVLIIFGSLFILAALALIIGGGVLLVFDSNFKDAQGFYTTRFIPVSSSAPVIVSQSAEIQVGPGWFNTNHNTITVRIEAVNDSPAKAVFVGIARESDLATYLSGISYDEVTDFSIGENALHYLHYTGTNVAPPPASQMFWVMSDSGTGTGTRTVQWNISSGNYAIILMNTDGSAPINAEISLGVKIPGILHGIGLGLLIGGIVLLGGGAVMIFFGVRGW